MNKIMAEHVLRRASYSEGESYNPKPQLAPGSAAAVGHHVENSIPLSIFPISLDKLCICFCGLPGRGKTEISRKIARYLTFFHAIPVEVFSVAEYRRRTKTTLPAADWFDASNLEATELRAANNMTAIEDMIAFLNSNENGVAILDSTNPTHERRAKLMQMIHSTGAKVLFIEVSNENEKVLDQHYKKVYSTSPDYEGVAPEQAEADYLMRISKYQEFFETINATGRHEIESRWSYFKCDHSSEHFVLHHVRGYMQLKIVNFIMNLRTTPHVVYLSRHGQSEYNAVGRIGGDSGLSKHGHDYAVKLAEFVEQQITSNAEEEEVPARLWTSTLRRTKETAQFIKQNKIMIKDHTDPTLEHEWVQMRPRAWHHLDELFAGQCDGMTYEEIEEQFPEEFERRTNDKLAYRYPRGESYLDVIARLEPMIIEMERHKDPLLIIAHQGILRIIYAYYMGLSRAESPFVSIPLNHVIELVPSSFNCFEKRHNIHVPKKLLPSDGQDEPSLRHANNLNPHSH